MKIIDTDKYRFIISIVSYFIFNQNMRIKLEMHDISATKSTLANFFVQIFLFFTSAHTCFPLTFDHILHKSVLLYIYIYSAFLDHTTVNIYREDNINTFPILISDVLIIINDI